MQNIGRVDIFQAAEDLVDEGLEVGIGQWLARANNGRQIALHQLWHTVRNESLTMIEGCDVPSYR